MIKLNGYKPGSNLTVMNVYYQYPKKINNKWIDDLATIVYKDNDTGEKHYQEIPAPLYTYYIAKKEVQIPHNMPFINKNLVEPITCKYRDIKKSIAENTGNLELFNSNLRENNSRMNQLFFKHPRVFQADMNILNYIRMEFAATYTNIICPIDIAYFDIETDLTNRLNKSEMVYGVDPINAISLYLEKTNTIYSFLLRDITNPQIKELEESMKNNPMKYKSVLHQFLLEQLGTEERLKKFKLSNVELSVSYYDDEVSMIVDFFNIININKPDFAVAYNMPFDLGQLIARLKYYKIDPCAVICHPDFKYKFCEYVIDERHANIPAEKGDFTNISSYTTYLDQLVPYASRRKGQKAIRSFKLDYIGEKECGVHKLDYSNISSNPWDLSKKNFQFFWLYNIIDTVVQNCIEIATDDLKFLFTSVINNNTSYQKSYRQTFYIANKATEFYKNHEGVIIGNNINKFNSKEDKEELKGAWVADPSLLSNKSKLFIDNIPVAIYYNSDDFDYKRLYPSLAQEFNMGTNTQIGRINIKNAPFKDNDNLEMNSGGTYCENLASYNFIEFCHRWLNMPNMEQMLDKFTYYFNNYRTPIDSRVLNDSILKITNSNKKEYDNKYKIVVYKELKNTPIKVCRPIPDNVKLELNKIREGIILK